ncbi:unnamed protein product, partial [Cuscuta europaea]
MNCSESITDQDSGYSTLNRLSILLLSFPKGKNQIDIDLLNTNYNTRVLPIKKKPNMPQSKSDSTQGKNFIREIIRRTRTEFREIPMKLLGLNLVLLKDKKSLEFPYDSTRSSSLQVKDSGQPKGSLD